MPWLTKIFNTLRQLLDKIRRKSLQSSVIKGTATVFTIQIIGVALGYFLQVLLARLLGAEEYGLYTYTITWATTMAIFLSLGFPVAVLRLVLQYIAQQDYSRLHGIIQGSQRLMIWKS